MNKKELIDYFFNSKKIAVVGVSRNPKKFGSVVYNELKKKNLNVIPVNPNIDEFEGEKCYSSLLEIKGIADAAIFVIPKNETEKGVQQAKEAEINNIWLQYGSASKEAVNYCKENNMNVIDNQCVLMFAEPVQSIHKFHRCIWKLIGKYPK